MPSPVTRALPNRLLTSTTPRRQPNIKEILRNYVKQAYRAHDYIYLNADECGANPDARQWLMSIKRRGYKTCQNNGDRVTHAFRTFCCLFNGVSTCLSVQSTRISITIWKTELRKSLRLRIMFSATLFASQESVRHLMPLTFRTDDISVRIQYGICNSMSCVILYL